MLTDNQDPLTRFNVGDEVEHKLFLGFRMKILETRECATTWVRPEPHSAYRVVDFTGSEVWLCSHAVARVATRVV